MTLAYRVDGLTGDRPVLVLSGALGTSLALWDSQLDALTPVFRVLRHDLPGHGRSPIPAEPVSIEAIGRALLVVLDELGIDRFSFCGLSLGGMVGLWLGAETPDRVERLVLACTGARLGTRELYAERAAAVRKQGVAITADGARERWFTPSFRESEEADRMLADLRSTPAEGYAACCEAVGAFDFRARLGDVAPPTLLLYGEEDPVTPPPVVDELAGGIRDARRVVGLAEAAHLANVEQPAAFADAVLSHLTERTAA